jgi:hypothetical protein
MARRRASTPMPTLKYVTQDLEGSDMDRDLTAPVESDLHFSKLSTIPGNKCISSTAKKLRGPPQVLFAFVHLKSEVRVSPGY